MLTRYFVLSTYTQPFVRSSENVWMPIGNFKRFFSINIRITEFAATKIVMVPDFVIAWAKPEAIRKAPNTGLLPASYLAVAMTKLRNFHLF